MDYTKFPFSPEAMQDFFKQNDFTKYFKDMDFKGMDAEALMVAQKKNMDALMEANMAAAAGFQALFKQQLSIFEQTMSEARDQMKSMETGKIDGENAKLQAEIMKTAFEKALANMKALAETAQQANAETYEVISARVKASVAELRDMMDKSKT